MTKKVLESPQEILITCIAAADLLKVSTCTIKRWLKIGKLSGTKLCGSRWKVFKADCERIIKEGKNLDA